MTMTGRDDDTRLRDLRTCLRDTEVALQRLRSELHQLQAERDALRASIAEERDRLRQEQARTARAREMNVIAQRDLGRTVPEIAKSLGLNPAAVHKSLREFKEREGVTVRRRTHPIREGRMLK
jgi:septal ring factor EnvC (AmiA/AmiB activator)